MLYFTSPEAVQRDPFSPHFGQHLSLSFFVMVMLMGVRRYLTVASICVYVYLMTNGVDHLFMCSLAIYISSVEEYLFRASAQFLIELSFYSLILIVLYSRHKFLTRYMIYKNHIQ